MSSGADAELSFVTAERCVWRVRHTTLRLAPCVHLSLHASLNGKPCDHASVISPSLRVCFVDPIEERMTDASATPGGATFQPNVYSFCTAVLAHVAHGHAHVCWLCALLLA